MNITILTNRDLASHIALTRLVKALVDHQLSIFISEKVGADHQLPAPLMELAAFEKHQLATAEHSFDDLAKQVGCELQGVIPVEHPAYSANSELFASSLKNIAPPAGHTIHTTNASLSAFRALLLGPPRDIHLNLIAGPASNYVDEIASLGTAILVKPT